MSVKRLIQRAIVLIAIIFVAAVVFAVTYATLQFTQASTSLAERSAEVLSNRLFADKNTRLKITDVTGNGVNRLALHGVTIEVRDGSDWVPWLEVALVDAEFDMRELAAAPHRVRKVRVEGARLHLPRAYEPKPKFRSARGDRAAPPVTDELVFQIDDLEVRGAVGARQAETFADFDAGLRLVVGKGFTAIDLTRSSVQLGQYPAMSVAGPLEIRGDTVYLETVTVEGGGSHLEVTGALDGKQRAHMRVELEPLALADVAQATGWEFVEGGGLVRGAADVEGDWSDLAMRLDLRAELGDDTLDYLEGSGRLANGVLNVQDVKLAIDGVPLGGEGRISFRRGDESWGRVTFTDVPLGDFPVLRDQGWLPDGELSGSVRVGSAAAAGRPFELLVSSGHIRGFVMEPGRFTGAIGPGGVVRLDLVDVVTRGAVLRGSGTIDPERGLDLSHDLTIEALDVMGAMFGEDRVSGGGKVRLAIVGPFASPAFSAAGSLDSLRVGDVELRDIDLAVGPGILQRQPTADLELVARSGRAGRQELGRVALIGNVRNDRLRLSSLELDAAGAHLVLRGSIDWTQGVQFRMDYLTATAGTQRWRSLAPFAGRRRGDVWELDPMTLSSPMGTIRAEGRFDLSHGDIDLAIDASRIDLSKIGRASWRRKPVGMVDARLSLSGRPDTLAMALEVEAARIGVSQFAVDSLAVSCSIAPSGLRIERLSVDHGGHVEASGSVRFAERLTAANLTRVLLSRAGWEAAAFSLHAASDGAEVGAWHGLSDTVDRIEGVVGFVVDWTGSPLDPSGRATITAPLVMVSGQAYEDLGALVTLSAGWIGVAALDTRVSESELAARGPLPIHFSLMEATRLDRQAPIDVVLELSPGDLSLSEFVTDKVIDTHGPVSGFVRIGGTLDEPRYFGKLDVTDATLRITGREEILTDVSTSVALREDGIRFRRIKAKSRDGRVEGEGVLFLDRGHTDGFDFDLEFEEFPLRSTGEYLAKISGALSWSQERGTPKPLPVVDATLKLDRLDYLKEVVGGPGSGGAKQSSWTGRVALDIPRHLWIRNQDLEAELKGNLTYERSAVSSTMLGELEVIRGTYGLFGHTFRVTDGNIRFVDPERMDPDLDVTAETRTPEGRVRLIISGRASDRQVTLESDDGDIDQAALWATLVPTDSSEMSNLVAMTPFIRDLEHRISQEVPGLSVSLEMTDPETGAAGGVGARVGKYVSPEVFVSGYQGFSSTVDQEVSVEYQISDLFFVTGDAERRGLREGQSRDIQEEYNINLNFRIEF